MKDHRLIGVLAAALLALCITGLANAADLSTATCSQADFLAVYAKAVDGDRINIAAGTCTWSQTSPSVTIAKALDIEGAGQGKTIINGARWNITTPGAWTVGNYTNAASTAGFNVTTSSKLGRIHHIDFPNVTGFTQNRVIWISPTDPTGSAGVIDHNKFATSKSIQIHVREAAGNGNASWARPLGLGGPDAWYIENNDFSQDVSSYNVSAPITDCDGGGRIVFRFNTITNNYTEMHDAIIGGLRSCRKWEIYGNHWLTTQAQLNATGQYAQIAIRGGTGVVFDNVMEGDSSSGFSIIFANYRTGGQTGGNPWTSTTQNSSALRLNVSPSSSPALCTVASATCVKLDGPGGAGLPANYPSRDQMGQDGGGDQTTVPALFYNNTVAGKLFTPLQEDYSDRSYLAANRDYCVSATKPTTCAGKPVTYQPYVWPHPLVSGAAAPPPPPPPPAPIDCAVTWGEWSPGPWNACDATTLSQSRIETRTATVTTQPANGGKACPALTETRTTTQPCTVPCPDPQPADELRPQQCTNNDTKWWNQERSYSCSAQGKWVAGAWSPATVPDGACPPLVVLPKVKVTTVIEAADCSQDDPNRLHFTCKTQTGVDVVVQP